MKKIGVKLIISAFLVFCLASCDNTTDFSSDAFNQKHNDLPNIPFSGIIELKPVIWNSILDIPISFEIEALQNTNRKNASGPKITSHAHNDSFPGINLIWDYRQNDSGYLKVAAGIFELFESFTLTSKEANTYRIF